MLLHLPISWTPTTGLSDPSSRTPILTVGSEKMYVVKVTSKNNCIGRVTVFVTPKLSPEVTLLPSLLVSLTSKDNVTFSFTTTGTNLNHKWSTLESTKSIVIKGENLSSNDSIWIQVTDTISRCSAKKTAIISYINGLEEISPDLISFYPNPTQDIIEVDAKNKKLSYSLRNELGKSISNGTIENDKTSIDMTNYAAGIYFIIFKYEDQVYAEKIIE